MLDDVPSVDEHARELVVGRFVAVEFDIKVRTNLIVIKISLPCSLVSILP